MTKKTIWAHTLVKNEERFLWYAVMSVVDFVDKILLWDTGSTDKTVAIIKEIQKAQGDGNKIDFREIGEVDEKEFTQIRQQMLDQTKSDWVIIVDGDEVWWEKSIRAVVDLIAQEGQALETIVSPYYNIVGDIYHYQEEKAGRYQIDDRVGHINIRAFSRKIAGLHLEKPHGQQGFYDGQGVLIQERPQKYRRFLNAPYVHFTNMRRSSSQSYDFQVPKRDRKFKYEIGRPFPKNFRYPEVFYSPAPEIVPSPWGKMSAVYFLRAAGQTLLKKIKRKLITPKGYGY